MPEWQAELRPLPQAVAAALAAGLLLTALTTWSAVQAQWPQALGLPGLALMAAHGIWRDVLLRGAGRPRSLQRGADGRLWLHRAGAAAEPVLVSPASLRWGRCLLLILRGRMTTWLWLGPGNLPGPVLAALRRELAAERGPGRRADGIILR